MTREFSRHGNTVDAEVGKRIRTHRLARSLTQTALADRAGVTFQQIQKYEKGVNRREAPVGCN